MRRLFVYFVISAVALSVLAGFLLPQLLWAWLVLGPLVALGIHDYFQVERSIPRNFPAIGRMRYLLEFVRPEIYQYFVESDTECELLGAIGLVHSTDLQPWHPMHRVSPTETKHYGELYDYLDDGELLREPLPVADRRACEAASAESFGHAS